MPHRNSHLVKLHAAIARAGKTNPELAEITAIPEARLHLLTEGGVNPTPTEARTLAAALDGIMEDYRDFEISDDPWYQGQSPDLQAQINRISEAALQGPSEALAQEQTFSRTRAKALVAAAIIGAFAILHVAYLQYRYSKLRRESYAWSMRALGYRELTIAKNGMEIVKEQIAYTNALSKLADTTFQDPETRASFNRYLIDMVRYWRGHAALFDERQRRADRFIARPYTAALDNMVRDPLTGQLVDVDAYDGGKLNEELIRKMLRSDMRVKEIMDHVEAQAKGKQPFNPDTLPLEDWGALNQRLEGTNPSPAD